MGVMGGHLTDLKHTRITGVEVVDLKYPPKNMMENLYDDRNRSIGRAAKPFLLRN